jgi:hypothetical protein
VTAALRATERIPKPLVIDAPVFNDVANRTLVVRRADQASGYQKLAWREAHGAYRRAEEAGLPPSGAPFLRASGGGESDIAYAIAGDSLTLLFAFPPGKSVYAELVSKPGLAAWVAVDVSTGWFQSVKFRHVSR